MIKISWLLLILKKVDISISMWNFCLLSHRKGHLLPDISKWVIFGTSIHWDRKCCRLPPRPPLVYWKAISGKICAVAFEGSKKISKTEWFFYLLFMVWKYGWQLFYSLPRRTRRVLLQEHRSKAINSVFLSGSIKAEQACLCVCTSDSDTPRHVARIWVGELWYQRAK